MITPQSANWTTLATARDGRGFRLQAYIEGIKDPICTHAPSDKRTKTYAVELDGTNDRILCGTDTALTNLADWTMCAWVKLDSLSQAMTLVGAYSAAPKGYWVYVLNGSGAVIVTFAGTAGAATITMTGATVAAGGWTYVAISLGGNTKTVVRGIINDTDLNTEYYAQTRSQRNSFTASQPFNIGALDDTSSVTTFLDGRVGYGAMFKRALTNKEMRQVKYRILNAAWGNNDSTGLWDVLVAQWDFERGTGTKATNSKNPGTHDGTLTNGPTWASDACYSVTYRECLSAEASTAQEIEPLATRTSVQSTTLHVLDLDGWFSAALYDISLKLPDRRVDLFLGFLGLQESEYQRVACGPITDFALDGRMWTVTFGDVLSDIKKKVRLGLSNLQAAIAGGAGDLTLSLANGTYWHDPDISQGVLKVDDEIMYYSADAGSSATAFNLTVIRGQEGTTRVAHSSGAPAREEGNFAANAREAILYLLLSGAGSEASSLYDIEAEMTYSDATTQVIRGRGAGMSPADVAVSEITGLSRLAEVVDVEMDDSEAEIKEYLESQVLRPHGAYFFIKSDGRLSVKTHEVPSYSQGVGGTFMLGPDQIRRATWSITHEHICNFIQAEFDYDLASEEYTSVYINTDAQSGKDYGLRKREYSFRAVDNQDVLDNLSTDIFARFADPYIVAEVECGIYEMLLEIGDPVYFTDLDLPNLNAGVRGVHEQKYQIVGRRLDLRRGVVTLKLADLSRA